MVGVPRRSRACEACKKRRLACDLGRPTCSQCKQEKRDCRFPNAFTFVVNDPGSHKTVYRKPSPGHVNQRRAKTKLDRMEDVLMPTSNGTPEYELFMQPPSDRTMVQTRPTLPPAMNSESLIPSIPQQLSNILPMQQLLLSHALQHFNTQPTDDTSLIRIWIPTLRNFATSTAQLKASPLACCAAWLARGDATNNPSLIDFSRHLYAQGLSEVRIALRRPGAILEDETLGACLALAVFEVIQCPDKCRAAYAWHRRASVNLLQMRGAKAHREGVGHELFLALRLHGIFYAYEQRLPNFLCTREWCTVPWQIHPKDDFNRLADILARGPQLLHEAETLHHKSLQQTLPTLLTILSRLLDIDSDLTSLCAEFEATAAERGERLYWAAEKQIEDEDEEPSSEPPLHFPSLPTASLLTLHWSTQTMVWSALTTLHTTLLTHFPSTLASLLPSTPRTTHFLTHATQQTWLRSVQNITRSVDFCVRAAEIEGGGERGPPGIGIALEIVLDVLKGKEGVEVERERGRAEEARREVGRRWVAILLA